MLIAGFGRILAPLFNFGVLMLIAAGGSHVFYLDDARGLLKLVNFCVKKLY